jgi:catechol 2,3-dioxygenase-like lactoylglutathione lyase family enzyme
LASGQGASSTATTRGHHWHASYNAGNTLASQTDACGNMTQFGYGAEKHAPLFRVAAIPASSAVEVTMMSETASVVPGPVLFQGVYPIGDTNIDTLPVQELGPAIGYYTQVLGFALVSKHDNRAVLKRDAVTIGLEKNEADPEQASCYFAVSDVDALRHELDAKGIEPSAIRVDEHAGRQYRVFFAKEPYGVCFCFGQPA